MRKNELHMDGYTTTCSLASSLKDFITEQSHLIRYMWRLPAQELGQQEAEREEFALQSFFKEAQQIFESRTYTSANSFCLYHPDLRVNNIIVDDKLHICGVLDWEFSVTVPIEVFLPPLWITGLDSVPTVPKPDFLSEFMSVLSSRSQLSPDHSKLAREWNFQDDCRLPAGYIFLDPSELVSVFYGCIYPKLHDEPRDEVVPSFFQRPENEELREILARRLSSSEQYTQYLTDNNLLDDDEEPEWQQQLRERIADTQKKLQELRKWNEEARDRVAQLEKERANQCKPEQT